jgi:hypothetical protein
MPQPIERHMPGIVCLIAIPSLVPRNERLDSGCFGTEWALQSSQRSPDTHPLRGGSCDFHHSLIMLPEHGTSLDVGEEEGDGAKGETGHDPSHCMRLGEVLADCRMVDGRRTSEKATVSSFVPCPSMEQVDNIVLRFTPNDAVALAAD